MGICCSSRNRIQALVRQFAKKQVYNIDCSDFLANEVLYAVDRAEKAKGRPVFEIEAYNVFKNPHKQD